MGVKGNRMKQVGYCYCVLLFLFMFIVVPCCHSLQNVRLVMHIWRYSAQVSIALLVAVTSIRTTVLFINLRQPMLVVSC